MKLVNRATISTVWVTVLALARLLLFSATV